MPTVHAGGQLLRLLARYVDIETLIDEEHNTISFSGDLETFKWIISQTNLQGMMQDVKACTRIALGISAYVSPFLGEILQFIFDGKQLTLECCGMKNVYGCTLLRNLAWNMHHCLRQFGMAPQELPESLRTIRAKPLEGPLYRLLEHTLSFMEILVAAGSELHEPSASLARFEGRSYITWGTPLLYLVKLEVSHSFVESSLRGTIASCDPIAATSIPSVYTWLDQLKHTGIDLNAYGHGEENFLRDHACFPYFYCWQHTTGQEEYIWLRLVSFTYGPEPGDWIFYMTEVMENWFVEFWDMVEHPERKIPGAWSVDDNNEDEVSGLNGRDPQYFWESVVPKLYKEEFGREYRPYE